MPHDRERLPVYLAAGGQSSRFGSPKSRALVAGEPLIQRVARLLQPWTSTVHAVAAPGASFADLNLHTIPDLHPGAGPLAALHAALHHVGNAAWLLLASCDTIVVEPHWIDTLLAARSPNTMAVAFQHPDGAVEPLLAVYRSTLRDEVNNCVAGEHRSLSGMLRALAARGEATLLTLPADWPPFVHVNTPAELAQGVSHRNND
jgi:molybdopterin-guanine dinucleotide biosynthesis protein A